jgi:hypothetical protein
VTAEVAGDFDDNSIGVRHGDIELLLDVVDAEYASHGTMKQLTFTTKVHRTNSAKCRERHEDRCVDHSERGWDAG